MLYFICVPILVAAAFRNIAHLFHENGSGVSVSRLAVCQVSAVIGMLGFAPFVYAFYLAAKMENGGIPANSSMRISVYCVLASGILAVIFYGTRVFRGDQVRTGVLAAMAGIYLTFVATDHLLFFRDSSQAGVVDAAFLKNAGLVTDIECHRSVLVNNVHGEQATYRCPRMFAIGGAFLPDPFVPWPSYTEGVSTTLGPAVEAIEANAKKLK